MMPAKMGDTKAVARTSITYLQLWAERVGDWLAPSASLGDTVSNPASAPRGDRSAVMGVANSPARLLSVLLYEFTV
jgi:hypothetical protein